MDRFTMRLTLVQFKEDSDTISSEDNRWDPIKQGDRIPICINSPKPGDIASRGCTVKMLNGNNFWWHGPSWLQKDHDDWPTWNVNILSKDIMDAISTENKEPKTLYEVSFLAEEDLTNNKQEDRKEDLPYSK